MVFPTRTVIVFGVKGYQVMSPSMVELYPVGTVVYIGRTSQKDVKIGDIIAFNAIGEFNMTDGSKQIMKATFTHYLAHTFEEDGVKYYKTQPYKLFHAQQNLAPEDKTYDEWYEKEGSKVTKDLVYKDIIGEARFQSRTVGHITTFFNKHFKDRTLILLIGVNIFIFYMLAKIIIFDFIKKKEVNEEVLEIGENVIENTEDVVNNTDDKQNAQPIDETKEIDKEEDNT